MAYRCINPESLSGERGDPPEYEPTEPYTCADCGETFDYEDDPPASGSGYELCPDCAQRLEEEDKSEEEDDA